MSIPVTNGYLPGTKVRRAGGTKSQGGATVVGYVHNRSRTLIIAYVVELDDRTREEWPEEQVRPA